MNMKKMLVTATAVVLVATTAVGCGSKGNNASKDAGTGTDTPKDSGQVASNVKQDLKINFSADPPVLDTSKATASASFTMIAAFNEGLYRLDKDLKATPGLAADMPQISEDGLTYTIKLKDGLVWSDGSPLTAKDFVYSYQRTLDPTTEAQYSFMLEWIKGGKEIKAAKTPEEVAAKKKELGVVAKDDHTLEITLVKPIPFFTELLSFITFFPQKQDFVEKAGEKYGAEADQVIGAGPFKLVKWDHEQSLEFVKNDKYWDAKDVKLEHITINVVKDAQTGLNLFETNAADFTDLTGDLVQLYDGKPEFTVKKELVNAYVMFQNKYAPFANANIRKALALSIDREALVKTILKNGSSASTGFVPNGTLDGNGNEFRAVAGDTEPKFNVDEAKKLLAQGLQELGMSALPKFSLTSDDTTTAKKTLEFIVSQWKTNLGIDAVAEPVPHELRIQKQSKHDYQALVALWGADYNDPMTFLDMWVKGGEFNEVDFDNAQYTDLVTKASVNNDRAERSKQLVEAEKLLMDQMPVAPLYFRNKVYAKRTNVEGMILPPYGQEWELKWAYIK